MDEQELFGLLEDYLEGRLDESAKSDLEKRLSSDVDLRAQLELIKYTTSQLKDIGLWHEIHSVHKTFKASKNKKTKGRVISFFGSRWVGVAASFLLVFAFVSISLYRIQPTKIAGENYMEYTLPVMRSEELNVLDYERFYQERDWVSLLEWVSNQESSEQKPYFLGGLAAYEMNAFSDALDYFRRVEKINATAEKKLFEEETDFYSALTYLQLGAFQEAYQVIDKMMNDKSHAYHNTFGKWDRFKIRVLTLKK